MYTWEYSDPVTLHGRIFLGSKSNIGFISRDTYADSYKEQDGYALVNGYKLHYWLYDTVSYHDGNAKEIYDRVIPSWVEGMGYVIDYDNIEVYEPNDNLANSVRMLMRQRGADMSVALVTKELHDTNVDYVVINEYFKSKGYYKTTIYYLYKDSYNPSVAGYRFLSNYAKGQGWSVHLDLYWPKYLSKNEDDTSMQKYFERLMQMQKEICSNCVNNTYIDSYVSEYCMQDGTTYRVVLRYLYKWEDGDVTVYKGSMTAESGSLMDKLYNSGWIKNRNDLNDEYKKQCDGYSKMMH